MLRSLAQQAHKLNLASLACAVQLHTTLSSSSNSRRGTLICWTLGA